MENFELLNGDEEKESFDFIKFFSENKTFIYSVLFYFCGLLGGSFMYKKCQNDVLNKILACGDESFIQLLTNNISVYFLLFALSLLMGLCLVGFPFINLIPMYIGFEAGMKVAYYYINYSVKG